MFAVIRTGGKQYKVTENDKIEVEKLDVEAGQDVAIEDVLFLSDGKKATVGAPLVKGAKVTAKVLEQKRAPKITIFKKKRRQNYRRKIGHKQYLTLLQITEIKAA